ncbi:MAG: LPS export ABC transporter ATP-binding protein [Planctomycetota bacterium]|nr:LPS export ABC transporter ATP-binding protein [Planctomycetota bacterium]
MSLLKVEGLVKTYGRRRVVDGIDFEVAEREIVGLLGPNGAGKTTSFRMTCGMVEPDAGRVLLHDLDVTSWPMYRRARDGGMGYLAQEQSVFRKLSVEDNIASVLQLLGMGRKQRKQKTEELLERFNITKIRKSKAQYISGGEKRRLEIARCLVSNPQIILLDEPFTGIDPVTINSIQDIITGLRDSGISILITDHREQETLAITNRSYVIRDGQVLCHGTPEEVLNNPAARKYYFGDSPALGVGRPLGRGRDDGDSPRSPDRPQKPRRRTA